MKKIEITFGILTIIAIVLKLSDINGASIILSLSMCTLGFFYCFLSFALLNRIKIKEIFKKSSYQNTTAKMIIGAIGIGMGLSQIIIGGFYRLQLYDGEEIQLYMGLIVTLIISIIAIVFFIRNKNNKEYYKRIFTRVLIIWILGFILSLTPKTTLIDIYLRNYPDYAKAIKNYWDNPNDKNLLDKVEQERQKMIVQKEQ